MDRLAIFEHLRLLPGVEVVSTHDAHYVFYDPAHDTPADKRQPFATLVMSDAFDGVSDLSRRGLFRVNVGVERATYERLLGEVPGWPEDQKPATHGRDMGARDVVLPHPWYAPMGWICIVEPSEATWERELRALVAEAHALARRQYERRHRARDDADSSAE